MLNPFAVMFCGAIVSQNTHKRNLSNRNDLLGFGVN
jgi:hypothetical protein